MHRRRPATFVPVLALAAMIGILAAMLWLVIERVF